jgi:hypothetical protein
MRKSIQLLVLLICFAFMLQSYTCGRQPVSDCAGGYVNDTTLLNVQWKNAARTIRLNDTIWITSTISDTFYNKRGTDNIVQEQNQLYLFAQPYKIDQLGTTWQLSYANINFNPVVKDGAFVNYYSGFPFLFRRNKPFNYVEVGFVVGRVGLYAITLNNGSYSGGGGINIYDRNNYCRNFRGLTHIPINQSNQQYWDSLNVSSLTLPNFSRTIINKANNDYILFRVVP